MSTIRQSPLLASLRALRNPVDVVPAGFQTTQQWAREWGLSRCQANVLISAGLSGGKLVRKFFRVRQADGRAQKLAHYAEKK